MSRIPRLVTRKGKEREKTEQEVQEAELSVHQQSSVPQPSGPGSVLVRDYASYNRTINDHTPGAVNVQGNSIVEPLIPRIEGQDSNFLTTYQQPSTSSVVQYPPAPRQFPNNGLPGSFFENAQNVKITGGSFEEIRRDRNTVNIYLGGSGKWAQSCSKEEEYDVRQQRQLAPQASTSSSSKPSEIISQREAEEQTAFLVQSDQHSSSIPITDYAPDNGNVIYERHLKLKRRGFPLWIPGPNMLLPMSYQRKGVDIGDVGIITSDGGFSFLFNIRLPPNDSNDPLEINPPLLPEGFAPISPPISSLDLRQFRQFVRGSYLASTNIQRIYDDLPSPGLSFETSAAEGAILTLPEGGLALDLQNVPRFQAYMAANIESWYRYANGTRGLQAKNGEIRLVIGCDKATSWGVAAVANITQHKTHHLKYRPSENSDGRTMSVSSIPLYQWECSGITEARVGPDPEDIEELKENDDTDLAIGGKYWNQSLFLRTLNLTLPDEVFSKINKDLGLTLVPESQQFQNAGGSNNSARISHNANSGSVNTSQQSGAISESGNQRSSGPELSGPSVGGVKERATMWISPSVPISHPADFLNKLLLRKTKDSNIRAVVTQDKDWYSVITDEDEIMPNAEELAERVLRAHHIREVDGIVYLEPKDHLPTIKPYIENPSSIDNLEEQSNIGLVSQEPQTSAKRLYEIYDGILLKLHEKDRTDAKTIFHWLYVSVRPMTLAEIVAAISVRFDPENGPYYSPAHQLWNGQDLLKKCSGLIVESEDGTIDFAHSSVKEYLLSDYLSTSASSSFHLTIPELSHSLISQTCLAYLLQFDVDDSVDSNTGISSPLACYAAEHWIFHAKAGGIDRYESSWTSTLAKNLFTHIGAVFRNWVQIWDLDNPFTAMQYYKRRSIPPRLYYASLAGLQQVCLQLLKEVDVNALGGVYGTALQVASYHGHEAVVMLLLGNRADPNARGGEYGNALQAASYQGHETIVKLLLKKEADPNAKGGRCSNALYAASWQGHVAVVRMLLQSGADPNAQGGLYGSALQMASYQGHVEIVELLLKKGADPNAQGGRYGNALQAASSQGHETVVELLRGGSWKEHEISSPLTRSSSPLRQLPLTAVEGMYTETPVLPPSRNVPPVNWADVYAEVLKYTDALQNTSYYGDRATVTDLPAKGVDTNIQGGEYDNALQAASYRGHETMVKWLLKKGVDPNAQGGQYSNALYAASLQGHAGVARIMLHWGADPNAQGGRYGTALQAASYQGHKAIVKLLLKKGTDPNAQAGRYGNALWAASWQGHEVVVKLLLDYRANPNAQGARYGNVLWAASWQRHEVVVLLLLKKGADPNTQGKEYGNALQAASWQGHESIVRLLLKNGADVNAQGGRYGNALWAASWRGHEVVLKLLLKNGADMNAQGGQYGNVLYVASWQGHKNVVKLLLENGADPNAQEKGRSNALYAASWLGHAAVVNLLLKNGADPNARGGKYGSALLAALFGKREEVARLLLDNGADVNAQGGYFTPLRAAPDDGDEGFEELLLDDDDDDDDDDTFYF